MLHDLLISSGNRHASFLPLNTEIRAGLQTTQLLLLLLLFWVLGQVFHENFHELPRVAAAVEQEEEEDTLATR